MAELFLTQDKVEAALAVIVGPVANGVPITIGKSSEGMALPSIICYNEAAEEEYPVRSGNYFLIMTVAVKHSAVPNEDGEGGVDPVTADQDLISAVFGAVMVGNLAEQLTAACPNLTVFQGSVQFIGLERGRAEKGHWVDMLHFRCLACGSRLAD